MIKKCIKRFEIKEKNFVTEFYELEDDEDNKIILITIIKLKRHLIYNNMFFLD